MSPRWAVDHEPQFSAREWQREFRTTPAGRLHTKKMNLRACGWTWERYQAFLYAQNGLCAVCAQPEYGENQHGRMSLAADHDHVTGEPRALLCHRCNRAEGLLAADADRIAALAQYVRRFN